MGVRPSMLSKLHFTILAAVEFDFHYEVVFFFQDKDSQTGMG